MADLDCHLARSLLDASSLANGGRPIFCYMLDLTHPAVAPGFSEAVATRGVRCDDYRLPYRHSATRFRRCILRMGVQRAPLAPRALKGATCTPRSQVGP